MSETDNNAKLVKPGESLCRLEDIGEAQSRVYMLDDGKEREFFIVRRGDAVHGYFNHCPHEDRWLQWEGESFLTPEGDSILCQAHGATFDIESGAGLTGPGLFTCLIKVPLDIVEGEVRLGAL